MIIKMSESKSIKEGMNWTNGEEEYEIASTLASAPVNSIIFIKKSYGGKNRTLKFEKVSTNKWVSLNKFNDRTDSYESDKSLKDKYIDGATWKLEKAVNESTKIVKESSNSKIDSSKIISELNKIKHDFDMGDFINKRRIDDEVADKMFNDLESVQSYIMNSMNTSEIPGREKLKQLIDITEEHSDGSRCDDYFSTKSFDSALNELISIYSKLDFTESKSTVTEAANLENAELNMKIAKTLGTKLAKEPKYRADLEAAGFELYDSDWSTYKNWAVKGPNGKSVVLSKGYDNKPRIYNSAHSLATKDAINVFDFVNYLTMDFTDRHDYRAHGGIGRTNSDVMVRNRDGSAVDANFLPKTKTQQYHDLQKSVKSVKWDIDYYSDKIDSIHKQIAQLQKDADKYLDDKSMSKDKLMTKLSEIDTLLKSMGVRSAEESLKMRIKESDDYIDSPKYIADRYLDFDIPDMCADTLKVLDNMSESTLAELISACRTFYNTLDEICTLHS